MTPHFIQSRQRHMIILWSIAFACAGLLVGYILLYRWIEQETQALQDLLRLKAEKQANVGRLEELRRFISESGVEQDKLAAYFIDEKSVADFLGTIEALGREMGLAVETLSLGVRDGVLKVEVSAEGPFGILSRFSALLERLPYKLRITRSVWDAEAGSLRWKAGLFLDVISFNKEN